MNCKLKEILRTKPGLYFVNPGKLKTPLIGIFRVKKTEQSTLFRQNIPKNIKTCNFLMKNSKLKDFTKTQAEKLIFRHIPQ